MKSIFAQQLDHLCEDDQGGQMPMRQGKSYSRSRKEECPRTVCQARNTEEGKYLAARPTTSVYTSATSTNPVDHQQNTPVTAISITPYSTT